MSKLKDQVAQGVPLSDELVIDAHCHMGMYGCFHVGKCSAADMVAQMDRIGIKACISAHHSAIAPDQRYGNDEVLQAMADFPRRVYGYATVSPNCPTTETLAELDRCIAAGMIGVKVHPDLHGCSVDDDKYRPVWEFTNDHRLPLLSHTSTGGRNPVKTFEKLAGMYPNVSILLGHSGFGSEGADQTIQVVKNCPNVYAEITGSTVIYGTLERMVREVGADRVLFGTDIPFLDPRAQVGRVAFAKITDEEKRKVFGLNAARIFGLPM